MTYTEQVGIFLKCSPTLYFCIDPQRLGKSPYFRRLPAWKPGQSFTEGICVAMMAGEKSLIHILNVTRNLNPVRMLETPAHHGPE